MQRQLDWIATEARAREMSDDGLAYARADILRSLPLADDIDRSCGTNNGGYYRDMSSVYAREQQRRRKKKPCSKCGR